MTAPLKVGDAVTIVRWVGARRVIYPTTVWRPGGGNVLMEVYPEGSQPYVHDHEGVTWCRGHTGPAVEALHVALALT